MKLKELSISESNRANTAKKHVLLIGPPPYRESGARVKFDLMLEYIRKFHHLIIHKFDLPVHHPLYSKGGTHTRINHPRTVIEVLRAISLVPRVENVVLFGPSDVCFSYGLVVMLSAKLFRRHCAVHITGGRAVFNTTLLPAFVRSACLIMAVRMADVFVVETQVARKDLPVRLRSKAIVIGGFRPRLPPDLPPLRWEEGGKKFALVVRTPPDKKHVTEDEKGLDVLLDAVDHLHHSSTRKFDLAPVEDMEWHIYGPTSDSLCKRMQRTPDITFHGMMTNDQLRDALRRHDVLVFPSRYALEGHPGVIIEAFMAGLPVIASDLPGPAEIVHHEVNGLIVKTGDANALATAMIRLSTDGSLHRQLAAGARASAPDFDQDVVLPELVKSLGLLPAGTGSI